MSAGCSICPRRCGADRSRGEGFCRSPETAMVARAALHFGEEPCISGTRGSGAVFFSGCNLRCVFCQNSEISRGAAGRPVSVQGLREIFRRLAGEGAHNINLVTPTHYSRVIIAALEGFDPGIPIVWNSSGYDSVGTLRSLEGCVQIYMPDLKYSDPALAARYSSALDYPQTARAAIREMYRQTGPFVLDGDGILQSGVLIRHLILPGSAENTLGVIDMIEDDFPPEGVMLSLMSQYTPMPGLPGGYPELQRRVTQEEYDRCVSYLNFSDIENGFLQDLDSATDALLPAFDGTGVI